MRLADDLRYFWNDHWRATVAAVTGAGLGVMGTLVVIEATPDQDAVAAVAAPIEVRPLPTAPFTTAPSDASSLEPAAAAPGAETPSAASGAPASTSASPTRAPNVTTSVSDDCTTVMQAELDTLELVNEQYLDSESAGHYMGNYIVRVQQVASDSSSPVLRENSAKLAEDMLSIRNEFLAGVYRLDVNIDGFNETGEVINDFCTVLDDPLAST